jgi:hypothetical protein
MIILLNIPTAANVIELAKFHSRDGCFNAGNIQFISYIILLRHTTSCIEELLEITIFVSYLHPNGGHLETPNKTTDCWSHAELDSARISSTFRQQSRISPVDFSADQSSFTYVQKSSYKLRQPIYVWPCDVNGKHVEHL